MASLRTPSKRAAARRRYVELARREALSASAPEPNPLLEQVRALYEDSAVPVRELAALAGVTERTLYKYAAKGGWKPRVVRLARGTGGRFARAADLSRPVRAGLKANDPRAAALAAERCARAAAVSDRASAEAASALRLAAAARTLEHLGHALQSLRALTALGPKPRAGAARRATQPRGFRAGTKSRARA